MEKKNNNQMLVIGVVIFVLLAGVAIFFVNRSRSSQKDNTQNVLPPSQEVLPTINPSVKVDLVADAKKQNITFTINGIPSDIDSIDYELVYEHDLSKRDIAEGAEGTRKEDALIGTVPVSGSSLTKKLYLGTCSATCTPHLGVESIKVAVKFVGASKTSIFEKEFSL